MRKWSDNISISVALFVLLVFGSTQCVHAQTQSDKSILLSQHFTNHSFDARHVTYLYANSKNPLVKYNPVSLVFGGLLLFYQQVLSGQIMASCPYEISCSGFSKAVISKYGILKGLPLSADRLMRCNSMAARDYSEFYFNERHQLIDQPGDYCFRH